MAATSPFGGVTMTNPKLLQWVVSIIGDGAWHFTVADMATLLEHQRKGLGTVVLQHLLAYIKENTHEDGTSFINLFTDPLGRELYAKNGFVTGEAFDELGMVQQLRKNI
jgi:GNAT superfamily N-acetyltransferase